MYFKQFYLGCLAHASYLLGFENEAVVIDPQRDIDQYIEQAKAEGLSIKYVIETHLHADFVSGHLELAAKTGAQIIFGAKAQANFAHIAAKDGDVFSIGSMTLTVLETPGHTPESICVLAKDNEKSDPAKLFSGDTLFIGDIGRPDLVGLKGYTPEQMAGLMFDSLQNKILVLPDDVEVYPAHGAGSLCGKHMSNEKSSTIGEQKRFNYALKPMEKEAFIKMMTSDLHEVPAYFLKDVELNRQGASPLNSIVRAEKFDAIAVNEQMQLGTLLLDIRSSVEFAGGHIKGSLNIGLSGQFASWAGILIQMGTPIILIAADLDSFDEAVVRLARVGIESVIGYLSDGIASWNSAGFDVVQSPVITVDDLKVDLIAGHDLLVLDVRGAEEYDSGHVPSAINIPLAELPNRIAEIPKDQPLAIVCASGYRSSIATSILERSEISRLMNVLGGTTAWKNAGFEIEKATA
jgi:hydroxyacylglutathione hydrolase